jgi:hypothetical protein
MGEVLLGVSHRRSTAQLVGAGFSAALVRDTRRNACRLG